MRSASRAPLKYTSGRALANLTGVNLSKGANKNYGTYGANRSRVAGLLKSIRLSKGQSARRVVREYKSEAGHIRAFTGPGPRGIREGLPLMGSQFGVRGPWSESKHPRGADGKFR